jgi:AhpD family alkylhydroperoxidase
MDRAAHRSMRRATPITNRSLPVTQRLDYAQLSPELFKKYAAFGMAVKQAGGIDETIALLLEIRASQLNGCAFCLDMHVKQAKLHGERELRLHHLAIWRESPLFSARERAALEWTEALTQLPPHGVSDAVYEQVRAQFSEQELVQLTFMIMVINGWNRINVGFRGAPGVLDKAYGLDKAGLN